MCNQDVEKSKTSCKQQALLNQYSDQSWTCVLSQPAESTPAQASRIRGVCFRLWTAEMPYFQHMVMGTSIPELVSYERA